MPEGQSYLEDTKTSLVISDNARGTNNSPQRHITWDIRICSNTVSFAVGSEGNGSMLEFATSNMIEGGVNATCIGS